MALPIEDYALIGDTQTGALVGRDGSIDWLCFPRFDSPACFAALLGTPENGRWLLAPAEAPRQVRRRYREGTLVLETEMVTSTGTVRIVDCMPPRRREPDVVRVVEGVSGTVDMRMDLAIRFDYGSVVPWVRQLAGRLEAVAGPEALSLTTPIRTRGEGYRTVAEFSVAAGDRVPFSLAWHPSVEPPPPPVDALQAADDTDAWWTDWSDSCTHRGPWRNDIVRSLVTLKGLTYAPTGGIVAAVTTSLPEHIGGVRNWDYRYCWLRDATFVLYAFLLAGYKQEASAWRDWLLRAVAGRPGQIQIMYGPAGERRLPEMELPWLPGYEGSAPVRVGNAAATQLQLDVFGEVLDALHQARSAGIDPDPWSWNLQRALVEFLESNWQQPDEGIWEIRGPRRDFTHSKVMAWVAFDRAVRAVERYGLPGPVDRWRTRRAEVHREVCEQAWDARRQRFTQFYGSGDLDASLLLLPIVGFLPPDDHRVLATLEAIERELCVDGLVYRYPSEGVTVDGLPPGEGVFLACSFWLADNFALVGRRDDALALFDRVRGLANDVGLLSEEYDVARKRLVGNFPQAFSHVGLVNTAINLSHGHGAAQYRQEG